MHAVSKYCRKFQIAMSGNSAEQVSKFEHFSFQYIKKRCKSRLIIHLYNAQIPKIACLKTKH